MRTNFQSMASKFFAGLTKLSLVVAMAIAIPACTGDDTDGGNNNPNTPNNPDKPQPEASYTYTGGDKTCDASEASVSFSFSTTAGLPAVPTYPPITPQPFVATICALSTLRFLHEP